MTNTINKVIHNGDEYNLPSYTAGTGLALNGTEFSNSGVTSVNGSAGDVTVQPTLVSGTNIKTINGTSVLGSGDLTVGGDVQVSSQANNILTSGTKLRCGTQANYEALGSYDSNTIYLTY